MRHGHERIGTMGGRLFDAVSVLNAAFARLVIDVEVLGVVVKANTTHAEMAA